MQIFEGIKRRFKLIGLSKISRDVLAKKITYLSPEKLKRIEKALDKTSYIEGDIVEFGVALGGSGVILAHRSSPTRRFIGFDLFGMIPPPTSNNDDRKSRDRYSVIASGAAEGIEGDEYYGYRRDLMTDVVKNFAHFNLTLSSHIKLVKGLFEDTVPREDIQSISLAHIDCDWYDPVKYCLEFCAKKLNRGGIIVVDDYHDYGGCRVAVDEFIQLNPDFILENGDNPYIRKI